MIGNKIAITIVNTAPPINKSIKGPNKLNNTPSNISTSCCMLFATLDNISSNWPLDSPLAIICSIIGGK